MQKAPLTATGEADERGFVSPSYPRGRAAVGRPSTSTTGDTDDEGLRGLCARREPAGPHDVRARTVPFTITWPLCSTASGAHWWGGAWHVTVTPPT